MPIIVNYSRISCYIMYRTTFGCGRMGVKVIIFVRLGKKARPGTFWENKHRLTGVPKKPLSKDMKFAVTPLVPISLSLSLYIYIYIYTLIHSYIHTSIHTYTHTHALNISCTTTPLAPFGVPLPADARSVGVRDGGVPPDVKQSRVCLSC